MKEREREIYIAGVIVVLDPGDLVPETRILLCLTKLVSNAHK